MKGYKACGSKYFLLSQLLKRLLPRQRFTFFKGRERMGEIELSKLSQNELLNIQRG